MISTFSKYFYTNGEENPMESSEVTDESRLSNIDHIITTNFLRKLRKIDSTENILNFVQLTEYKKTAKSKPRKSKNKQTQSNRADLYVEERRDEALTNVQIKDNDYKSANDDTVITESNSSIVKEIQTKESEFTRFDKTIQKKESDRSVGKEMHNKESENRIHKIFQKKESSLSVCKEIQNTESENHIGKTVQRKENDPRFGEKIQNEECDSISKLQIKETSSRISQIFEFEADDFKFSQFVEIKESDSRTSQKSILQNPLEISRKEKGESINIVIISDDKTSSYESITGCIVKRNSSKYFETKSMIEEFSNENITQKDLKDNISNQGIFSPCRSEIDNIEGIQNASIHDIHNVVHEENSMPLKSSSKTDLVKTISSLGLCKTSKSSLSFLDKEPVRNDDANDSKQSLHESHDLTQPKEMGIIESTSKHSESNIKLCDHECELEMKISSLPPVEEFVKQINCQTAALHEDSDFEETAVLFKRNTVSNESIDSRVVHFDNSKIPIPIKTKPKETPQTNDKVYKENLDDREKFTKEADNDTTNENISTNDRAIPTMQEESDNDLEDEANKAGLENIEKKETLESAETLRGPTSSKISHKYIRGNQKKAKISRIKSKLSIFNSGTVHAKLNRNKDTKSKIPLNPGNNSYASFMARRKLIVEDNLPNKNIAPSSVKNTTQLFIRPESSYGPRTIRIKTPNKIGMKRVDKSEIDHKPVDVNEKKKEPISKTDVSVKNNISQCDDSIDMICKLNGLENDTFTEHCILDTDNYVIRESSKVKNELKKYCEYVEEIMSEVAMEQFHSMDSSNALKTKVELLKGNRRRALELKSRELTESVIQALSYMGAEYKTLSQNCQDTTKKNEESVKKLREKFVVLKKENERLSTQVIDASENSTSSKTNVVQQKKKDEQMSEIQKIYNDIEMKNNYHAQLVENFMKSVKMIENKINHHSKLHDVQEARAKSEIKLAEIKKIELEETIEQLKNIIQENQIEHRDLLRKIEESQHIVGKLKAKNKMLHKELLKYKYPVFLEKNIQKMITLRNILFNIVHKNDDDDNRFPLQDNQMLDIMRQIDHADTFFPELNSPSTHVKSKDLNIISKTTTKNDDIIRNSFDTLKAPSKS